MLVGNRQECVAMTFMGEIRSHWRHIHYQGVG